MPPKDKKKEVVAQPADDGSGVVKQVVDFKIGVSLSYVNIADTNIVFQWFSGDKLKYVDLGSVDAFPILATEDSLPLEQSRKRTPDLEESKHPTIEDEILEAPKQKVTHVDHSEDGAVIDLAFCKNITSSLINVFIVNTETKKVVDSLSMDVSSILMHDFEFKGNKCFEYKCNEWSNGNNGIYDFKFSIESNKPQLQPKFRHEINPMSIEVDKVEKQFINSKESYRYENMYVSYNFLPKSSQNLKEVFTNKVKQQSNVTFKHKHVFLLGIENQVNLREYLQSNQVTFEIHDRDETKKSEVKEERQYVVLEEKEEHEVVEEATKGKKGAIQNKKKEAPPPKKEAKKAAPAKKNAAGVNMDEIEKLPEKEYLKSELGCADFYQNSLLNPFAMKFKLSQTIVPKKKYFDTERNNLDLNSNARKKAKDLIECPLYMDNTSSVSIKVEISFPIGTYIPPESPSKIQAQPLADTHKPIDKKGATRKQSAKSPEKANILVNEEDTLEHEDDILRHTQTMALRPKSLPYERAIYVFSYKNTRFLQELQKELVDINLACLGIEGGNERDIRTRKLTDAEKKNQNFDYIGGVEIIDKDYRIFILEGMAGRSMEELSKRIRKLNENTQQFKILRNSKQTYNERLYTDFDVDVKKIKLRKSVNSLTNDPDIYLRARVPEDMYNTIIKIRKIREKFEIKEVSSSDLWLTEKEIVTFERNYGDALTDFDLYGIRNKKRVKKRKSTHKNSEASVERNITEEHTSCFSMNNIRDFYMKESEQMSDNKSDDRVATERAVQFKQEDDVREETLGNQNEQVPKKRYRQTKEELLAEKAKSNEKRDQIKKTRFDLKSTQSQREHITSNPTLPGATTSTKIKCQTAIGFNQTRRNYDKYKMQQIKPVEKSQTHIINQAVKDIRPSEDIYTCQLRNLREVARKDKDHFYTWSDKYFSLSIDPYTEKEVKKDIKMDHLSRMRTKNGFVSKLRDPTSNEHPKHLHYTTAEDIKFNPYHIHQDDKKKMLQDRERENLPKNKPLFKNYLPKLDHAKEDGEPPMDNMSATEKQKFQSEQAEKDKEAWKKKMIVTDPHFYVNKNGVGTYNLDKYRGMLHHDPVLKKGLVMGKKYMKNTTLDMDQVLKAMPISYNLKEDQPTGCYVAPGNDYKFKIGESVTNKDFITHQVPSERKNYICKPRRYDAFTKTKLIV